MTDSTTTEALPPDSAILRFGERLTRLPRLARIALAALFAVATTLLLTPIIDNIYLTYFFDFNTRIVPALVSTAAGVVVYLVGWVLMVGFAGTAPPPRRALFWFFVLGCLGLSVAAMLLLTGALDMAR